MGKVLYLNNSSRTIVANNDQKTGMKFSVFTLLKAAVVRFFFFVLASLWWFVTLTILFWWVLLGLFLLLDILVIGGLYFSNNYNLAERMVNLVLPLLGITLGIFGVLRFQLTCHPKRFTKQFLI